MKRSKIGSVVVALAGVVAGAICLHPAPAFAALGDGLAVGPARLHLGVEGDLGYDSQAGAGTYADSTGAPIQNPADGIGTALALIGLEGKSDAFKLNLSGDAGWTQYAGLFAHTSGLSYFKADATGMLQINPDGPFGVDISEAFARSDQTTNPVFGLGIISLTDSTKIRLRFRPGGGAIEFGVGGEFGLNVFAPQMAQTPSQQYPQCSGVPTCDPGLASAYNSTIARGIVDAKWRFLPKTGLTFDASFGSYTYWYGQGTPSYSVVPNLNALPYNALIGFGTLLSTRFSFAIKGGYQGITFQQDTKANYGSWAGEANVGFRFTDSASTRLGFIRNFTPVGGVDHWYGDDRIYWELTLQPTSKLNVYALASVDFIGYGGSTRGDTAYEVSANAEYSFLRWLKLIGRVDVASRSTQNLEVNVTDPTLAAYNYTLANVSVGLAALF